jgi:putative protein-disulfide isomerase
MLTTITYLLDPLCGWCYGATPALDRLAVTPGIDLKLAPTGLFSGEGARPMDAEFAIYAWLNDQRIARLSGQVFSQAYRRNCLLTFGAMFDSGPAALALTAVASSAAAREREALKAIQNARYADGRDTTKLSVLSEILHELGLSEAGDRIAAPDEALLRANRTRIAEARAEMRQFGIDGVPALLVGNGPRRLVRGNELFGNLDRLLAGLPD